MNLGIGTKVFLQKALKLEIHTDSGKCNYVFGLALIPVFAFVEIFESIKNIIWKVLFGESPNYDSLDFFIGLITFFVLSVIIVVYAERRK